MKDNDNKKSSDEAISSAFLQGGVMCRWFFFYEGEEDGWTFKVEAKDYGEAFDKAYEMWGPQVQDMYYRLVS